MSDVHVSDSKKMDAKKLYRFLDKFGISLVLALLCLIFGLFVDNFATALNVTNIFTQITINTVIAVGMTFVILLGGIDLSVGSVLALCTILSGMVLASPALPPALAVFLSLLVSMAVGMACGFFNGFVSTRWRIHSFVVTLGMLNIARGLALTSSNARTISNFPRGFVDFGTSTFLGLPVIFIVALALVVLGYLILTRTVFGRLIYAIGNNEEAVRLSGHRTGFYKVLAFVICGAMVGVAGILYMLRLSIASPILGVGFELNAIAAVVIGGASMSGGKGSLAGTFLGASIMGVLNNGLLLLGLGDFARQIITGLIIVGAVVLDTYRARLSRLAD